MVRMGRDRYSRRQKKVTYHTVLFNTFTVLYLYFRCIVAVLDDRTTAIPS